MQRLMRLRDRWTQILLVVCAGFLMLFTQACSGKMNAKRFEGITPESSPVTVPQSLMRQTIESEVAPQNAAQEAAEATEAAVEETEALVEDAGEMR
ncbi:hypothetical protein [Lusitaniella coriacea]|uniref:hypothetical protein n=1 Tax=Lusitaniella coriacea TaxID=1983105 RepID=UPI003CF0E66D